MRPPYLPDNPVLRQSRLRQIFEAAPKDALNLALGQPGEDTPAFIREAAAKAAREAPLGYTPNAGILPLRAKLADELGVPGLGPDRICLTAGVQEGLYALFYALFAHGQGELLLPDPGFFTYASLAGLNRVPVRTYALSAADNFRFSADAVIGAVRPTTTAILLGHPSNPTGSNASAEELEKLIAYCENRKEGPLWIISDEVYFGMSYSACASMEAYLERYPWLIVLRGASKSHHMTGWRLGWAVLPQALVPAYVAAHQYVTTCASALVQQTFLAIRGSAEEAAWMKEQNTLYRRKRDLVEAALGGLRPLYGGEGAFYWVLGLTAADQPDGDDDAWVMRLMREHKIMTAPGGVFGTTTAGMVRLSYGPKLPDLEAGLDRLKAVFQSVD